MAYKQIHETFWTDPEVKRYTPLQKYLFFYLITGPHAHYSGMYYLPIMYIQKETGLSLEEIEDGMKFLAQKGHILYDPDREIVLVKSAMKYQWDSKDNGKVKMNEKQLLGLKKHLDTLHKSPLIRTFLEIYHYLGIQHEDAEWGIDTRINTGMDRDSVPVSVPVSVTVDVPASVPEGKTPGKTGAKKIHLDSVLLSDAEYRKLQEAMGLKSLNIGIEQLDYSITVKGGKYKDHYKTLMNWFRRGFLNSNHGGGYGKQERGKSSGEYGASEYPVDIEG